MERKTWTSKSSEIVYQNPYMSVVHHEVVRPDGSLGVYGVIKKPDFVAVVAETAPGYIRLVEQFRFPVQQYSWEVPEGGIEDSESELQAVQRELQEEAGLATTQYRRLGYAHIANGHTSQGVAIYLAQECTEVEHAREATEQDMVQKDFSIEEVFAMIKNGVITDSATILAMYFYKML